MKKGKKKILEQKKFVQGKGDEGEENKIKYFFQLQVSLVMDYANAVNFFFF